MRCLVLVGAAIALAACGSDDSSAPPPDLLVAPIGGGGQTQSTGGAAGASGSGGAAAHAGTSAAGASGVAGSTSAAGNGGNGAVGGANAGGASGSAGTSGSGGAGGAPTPCNVDPWSCGTGKTCWISDTGGDVACFLSKPGKKEGDCCTNIIGMPTCSDGMMCFGTGNNPSQCIPFCDDDAHKCGTGETCTEINYVAGSPSLHVCKADTPATTCAM